MALRVRYSETDQMGTFYNSKALDWFECGRTELLRAVGMPYASMEARGVFLPVIEAHVQYLGRARYDDLLELTAGMSLLGRARLRCDVRIQHAQSSKPVVRGYTIHAFADEAGKVVRPPAWFFEAVEAAAARDASVDRVSVDSLEPQQRPGVQARDETELQKND